MKLQKFYGGVLPQSIKECQLDNAKILSRLNKLDCPELLVESGSAVNEFDFLAQFMQSINPEPVDVIEIGTFLGIGTTLLASYSRTVFTFDIMYRNSHPIWDVFGVVNRINCYTGNQEFIDKVIRDLQHFEQFKFNLAVIDGEHKRKNVEHDFELVNFCGRVLFHDVNIPEIREFVIEEIGGKILNEDTDEPAKFGYWEAK